MAKKGKQVPLPIFVQDWLGSTRIEMLSAGEERGFMRLLMHQWQDSSCSLPLDEKCLSKLSKLFGAWKRSRGNVLQFFVPHPTLPGRIHNEKCTEKRKERDEWEKSQSESGKEGAKVRWGKDGDPNGDPIPYPIPSAIEKPPKTDGETIASLSSFPIPSPKETDSISESSGAEPPRDPATEIDYKPIEAMLTPFPARVRTSALQFAGFIANGFTTQNGLEDTIRRLLNRYESYKIEPGPWEKFLEKGVNECVKRGIKSVEYALKCMNTEMLKWRESRVG